MSVAGDEESIVVDPPQVPRHERDTRRFDPRDLDLGCSASWPLLMSLLERIDPQAIHAFRLGVLELARLNCAAMARPDASPALVDRHRKLGDMLAKMPWEAP